MEEQKLTRRTVLISGLAGAAVLALPFGCVSGDDDGAKSAAGVRAGRDGRFLTDDQYAVVQSLVGLLIPEDRTPGAITAVVADYIDLLLGAFNVDPPRIYASGPYSGRHGGDDRFDNFLPLSRVQEIAWRTTIEGSRGIAEREFNGPVTGWQEIYMSGIAELDTLSQSDFGALFVDIAPADQWKVVRQASTTFIDLATAHAIEGMYAAPEYGGNRDLAGWKSIGFEGDRQPVGYNLRQMSEPDDQGELGDDEIGRAMEQLREALERKGRTIW